MCLKSRNKSILALVLFLLAHDCCGVQAIVTGQCQAPVSRDLLHSGLQAVGIVVGVVGRIAAEEGGQAFQL